MMTWWQFKNVLNPACSIKSHLLIILILFWTSMTQCLYRRRRDTWSPPQETSSSLTSVPFLKSSSRPYSCSGSGSAGLLFFFLDKVVAGVLSQLDVENAGILLFPLLGEFFPSVVDPVLVCWFSPFCFPGSEMILQFYNTNSWPGAGKFFSNEKYKKRFNTININFWRLRCRP